MSSRKRPLSEVPQAHSTPARYAPSTPHAIRAIQQRSGVKTRSARSTRHATADAVRPDSIRGVLRQFAKIAAPATKKRVITPSSGHTDKENYRPDNDLEDDNDSILLNKPHLNFTISESIDEDDSELPIAPTPSVLPDEDEEQPTVTFLNVSRIPVLRPTSEPGDRRRSRHSFLHSEPATAGEEDEQDEDTTIMTERGRRAFSEEATGRFSRYSFGSIRMSEFGSELEFQRDSLGEQKTMDVNLDDYTAMGADESFDGGDTEDIRRLRRSHSTDIEDNSVHLSIADNETFALESPDADEDLEARSVHAKQAKAGTVGLAETTVQPPPTEDVEMGPARVKDGDLEPSSRRQTLLETATTKSHTLRRKRVKLTRHGLEVPSLPTSLMKRIISDSYELQSKRKPKLGKDHMKALEQATEWFFEQVGEDLAAYSSHGRRKKRIDAADVLLLMKRQKVLAEDGDLRRLAKVWLPKDDADGLDLPDTL